MWRLIEMNVQSMWSQKNEIQTRLIAFQEMATKP